jgi:opacity protein-like surface antigen
MRKILVGAVLAATVAAAPSHAQTAGTPVTSGGGSLFLSPYVGYITFGELADLGGDAEFSLEDGLYYGAQAGFSFSPNVALIGNLGYTKTKFVAKDIQTGSGQADFNLFNNQDVGAFFYDATLQFKVPFLANSLGSNIAPFVQAGLGAVRYTNDTDDLFDGSQEGTSTNLQIPLAVGVDVNVRPRLGLRLMVRDQITSQAFKNLDDLNETYRNGRADTAHNFAYTVGLNFGF